MRRPFNKKVFVCWILSFTEISRKGPCFAGPLTFKPPALYCGLLWFNSATPLLDKQVSRKQVEFLNICQSTQSEHEPGRFTQMDTRMHHGHQTITAASRPQATCTPPNWCLLPSAVHHRGPWKRPHRQTAKLPRKPQTKVPHSPTQQSRSG